MAGEVKAAKGTFIASDGNEYKYTAINGQIWMAENLGVGSCGSNYTYSQAMTACPSGWHLPTRAEWQALIDFAGIQALKSTSGWSPYNGTDAFEFAILPCGSTQDDRAMFMHANNGADQTLLVIQVWEGLRWSNWGNAGTVRCVMD